MAEKRLCHHIWHFSVALSKVDWDKVEKYGAQLGLSEEQVLQIKIKADEWVEETFKHY